MSSCSTPRRNAPLTRRRNDEHPYVHPLWTKIAPESPAMTLPSGTRFGPYEVVGALGAGGMGEVYRAHDSRLGRDVAIKVLPERFSSDPSHLARFEREARLLAALNHPHIAAIYGVEEAGGVRALVLELVEGETLAERVQRRIAVPEALEIGRQIAEALEAAHERGIIHRDLKPANVKIAPDGAVKVLDLGLAKAVAAESSDAELQATEKRDDATREGTILGTVSYMSPEQTRGMPVDKRTDIWAFGCVLYEMLAGELAFGGRTMSDRMAAILGQEPRWDRLPEGTPSSVRRLLRRCLEKEQKRRLRDIGEARIELEDALAGPAPEDAPRPGAGLMTRRTALAAVGGAVAGAAGIGTIALSRWRGALPRKLTRFAIAMPDGEFHRISLNARVAISPDGSSVAFNTIRQAAVVEPFIYTRALRELASKRVEEARGGASAFFSPDGRSLGYFMLKGAGSLRRTPLGGGGSSTLCPVGSYSGATWADGDTIYFAADTPGGVSSVPAAGGRPVQVLRADTALGERVLKFPCALPGGKALLVTVATVDSESYDDARIVAIPIPGGQRKVLIERGTHPRYSPSGHLVFARDGRLFAVRFDPDRLEVSGKPFAVLEGVLMSRNSGVANFDVSASGDLVYIPGVAEGGARTLDWVDRSGTAAPLGLPSASYLHPRISPDARRLAIEIEGTNHDIYVYDFLSGVLSNLSNNGVSHWPIWSPDGVDIGYRSGPMGNFRLWQVRADRSLSPQQVTAAGSSQSAESFSPDGRALAYTVSEPGSPPRITIVPLHGDRTPRPLDSGSYAQGSPKFSPDGQWLAYCSNESGKPQVYVQAFPGPGAKIQVSSEGGTDPVWRRSGGELFYRNGDGMMAVPVSLGPGLSAGRPQKLWMGDYSHGMSTSCGPAGPTSSNYDVTPDGQRFLMISDRDRNTAPTREIVVALGWAEELSRLSKGA